jgi:NitT/TauT family transport system permease protein
MKSPNSIPSHTLMSKLRLKSSINLLIQVLSLFILFAVWQLASFVGLLNPAFIPSPLSIIAELGNLELYPIIADDAAQSLSRMFTGLLLSYILTALLMFLSIQFEFAGILLGRVRSVLKFLPPPVLIPLAILGVGINNGAVIGVVMVSGLFLMLDYSFTISAKEVAQYQNIFDTWRVTKGSQFINFFVPISHFLSYRFISSLLIWALSVTIFSEIVIGSSLGFGPRLIQLQQLYQSSTLFGLIIFIVLIAFICERILVNTFSRYRFDTIRIISGSLTVLILISSVAFQGIIAFDTRSSNQDKIIIATYRGTLNLPLFVYDNSFNTGRTALQVTGSGIQALDTLLADRSAAAGYSDIPNVLAALNTNTSLKLLSQVEEKPDNPLLYMLSNKAVSKGNYSELNGSKIAYFPNNPIIESGLGISLAQGGAAVSSIEFLSSNDPDTLTQSFVSGQIDTLVTIEPYVTQAENQTNVSRVNIGESLIEGIPFQALPLAGLMIDPGDFDEQELAGFVTGLQQAIEYIRNNTSNGLANEELRGIMQKYSLDPDSRIPDFVSSDQLDPASLNQITTLIRIYDPQIGKQIEGLDTSSIYFKP